MYLEWPLTGGAADVKETSMKSSGLRIKDAFQKHLKLLCVVSIRTKQAPVSIDPQSVFQGQNFFSHIVGEKDLSRSIYKDDAPLTLADGLLHLQVLDP